MRRALSTARHELAAGHIALMHTGRDAFYGDPDYMFRGPGVTTETTRWLYEQGVRVMGSMLGVGTRP